MHYCAIVATGQLCKFEGQPMRSLSSSCETIDLDPAYCILYTQNFLAKEVFLSEVMYHNGILPPNNNILDYSHIRI